MIRTAELHALHPTQMTLGMREVARRMAGYLARTPEARVGYIATRVVPCVSGPGGVLYLIDRHHLCRALLEAGVREVVCDVLVCVGDVAIGEFWDVMRQRGWVHPFDAQGRQRSPLDVPRGIGQLVDDPYRSLAGIVRRDNGYEKAHQPFEDFAWANYLRARVPDSLLRDDFMQAVELAKRLVRSPDARHLPGWIG